MLYSKLLLILLLSPGKTYKVLSSTRRITLPYLLQQYFASQEGFNRQHSNKIVVYIIYMLFETIYFGIFALVWGMLAGGNQSSK